MYLVYIPAQITKGKAKFDQKSKVGYALTHLRGCEANNATLEVLLLHHGPNMKCGNRMTLKQLC